MTRLIICVAMALSVVSGAAQTVEAQESDNELRRQNQQLSDELQDARRELDRLRERNRELEQRVTELEQELREARAARSASDRTPAPSDPQPSTDPEPERVSIDESIPTSSPRALFNALVESYEKATEGMEIGNEGDGTRRAYLKKLTAWRAAVARELRAPIIWHVRVIDARMSADQRRIITMVAVDPETDVRLGNPFDVQLSRTLTERLARFEALGVLDVLVLRGTLHPQVRINEERIERGTFDNPPFIGPFAEFDFRIDVTSLLPVQDEQRERQREQQDDPDQRAVPPTERNTPVAPR